jgi:hypothetical protein
MGSHKSRSDLEDKKGTDMVMANRHNWATIGKRLPSDWSWLHTELPDIWGGCIAAKVLQKMMAFDSHSTKWCINCLQCFSKGIFMVLCP